MNSIGDAIESLIAKEYEMTATTVADMKATIISLRQQLASRDAEIAELKAWNSELVKHQDALADMCDQLREQVKLLRGYVLRNCQHADNCDVLTLDDEDKHPPCSCGLARVIAATEPGSTHQDKSALFKSLGLVPWDNKPPACTDTVWIEPGKIAIKKPKDPAP